MRIINLLKISAIRQPDCPACVSGDIKLSYADLLANVSKLARELKEIGCEEGVKVAIVLNNSIEYIICMFAVWAAKGILVPLHGSMTVSEIEHVLHESDTAIVITDFRGEDKLSKLIKDRNLSILIKIHYIPNSDIKIHINKMSSVLIDEQNQDVALMISTSGSTGNPKIVMHRESSLISNMQSFKKAMHFDGHHKVLLSVKIHHIYCICAQILTHISRNDTLITDDAPFFADDFLKKVEDYKVSITAFIPAMLMLVANYPNPDKYKTSSLQTILCAGANIPRSCIINMKKKYPNVKCVNAYGLTEAGPRVFLTNPLNSCNFSDNAGKCIPGVNVKILDKCGNELPTGKIGEIYVKSTGIMKGYYKRPDLTEQTIINGWLRTGDLGKKDKDEKLIIAGRLKDVINSGGDNIYPAEIEECIIEHPDIEKTAVIGKPDRIFQEVPCAFIVCKKGGNPTSANIIKWCKSRLSAYKVPREVIFIREMPMLSTFKYDKQQLRKMLNKQIPTPTL